MTSLTVKPMQLEELAEELRSFTSINEVAYKHITDQLPGYTEGQQHGLTTPIASVSFIVYPDGHLRNINITGEKKYRRCDDLVWHRLATRVASRNGVDFAVSGCGYFTQGKDQEKRESVTTIITRIKEAQEDLDKYIDSEVDRIFYGSE